MIDKIDNEMKVWENYYNSEEGFLVNIFIDVLASMTEKEREDMFVKAKTTLVNLKEPIKKEKALQDIKSDLEAYENIKQEAGIAYRTLGWVKEELEKDSQDSNIDEVTDNVNIILEEDKDTKD